MFKGIALNFSTWYVPRVSRPYETFVFCQRGRAGEDGAKSLPRSKTTLLLLKACKLKQRAIPKTVCVFSNMLKKNHHHHHQCGINFIISHRKISRMELEIFMIHLCTIATLMFLQNNTSQKILFIAARTIQFPGVVMKNVSI